MHDGDACHHLVDVVRVRSAAHGEGVLEFKPAIRIDRESSKCRLEPLITEISVATVDGESIAVRTGGTGPSAYHLEETTKILIRDLTALKPGGPTTFDVVVFPEEVDAQRFRREFNRRPECSWLVTLDGAVVESQELSHLTVLEPDREGAPRRLRGHSLYFRCSTGIWRQRRVRTRLAPPPLSLRFDDFSAVD